MVLKYFTPVAVPVSAPVISSVWASPFTSVPVTVKVSALSSPADRRVTIRPALNVAAPPEVNAPPRVKFAAPLNVAATDKPLSSKATVSAVKNTDFASLPLMYVAIAILLLEFLCF